MSENQQAQLQFLTKANPTLYRAYLLKENLRLALKAGPDEIAGALTKWLAWAQRCRIPTFRELRRKIKRHFSAIVAAARFKLSNARSEATNNKIKLIIRTAFGFRNVDNMVAMVMLSCSELHPALPGRCATHTNYRCLKKYYTDQFNLVDDAYCSLASIRNLLHSNPAVKYVKIPDYLIDGTLIVNY